jgi:protein-tyrosine phosphatase
VPWPAGRSLHGGVDEVPLPGCSGRLWLAGKRYVGPDPSAAMASVGATVVVCLCEEEELADRYPRYVAWLRHDPAAWWWPIPDLHAPEVGAARQFLSELVARLDAGEVVLMHCGAGIGRAGTMAAGALIILGLPRNEALAVVAAARPMAGPEAGAQKELLAALAAGD